MNHQHIRTLHELNREHPDIDAQALCREYHFRRLDEISAEADEPQLLLHIFPEHLQDAERLVNLAELEELLVPGICRGQFDRDRLSQFAEIYWDRATATFENHRDLVSTATLYDTGLYETVGNALCYPLDSRSAVDYAISSQDLEQCLVATLCFYNDLLPDDSSLTVYTVLSGVVMDNVTMDQSREVQRSDPLDDAEMTSRLTPVDLDRDVQGLRDQVAPLLRPFWLSQTLLDPDIYYTEDGVWEFADDLD